MRKKILISISAVMIIALAAGGTLAYLKAQSGAVKNTFMPASNPKITVEEKLDEKTKSDVKVKVEDGAAGLYYIRTDVVVNELDEAGNIIAASKEAESAAEEIDSIIKNTWYKGSDGFYYYKGTVAAGECTENLFDSFSTDKNLKIDILAQAVQANPPDAVKEAWGMKCSNGVWENSSLDADK